MKLNLEFNNLSGEKLKKDFFEKILEKTLKTSALDFLVKKNISVSLAIVKPDEIKKLNRRYRKINTPTDGLSFAEYKNQKELARAGDKNVFLGELVLCYNQIKVYAKKDKRDVKVQLAEAVAHGLLHLLNFRHGKKMFHIQKSAAENK